MWIKQDCRNPYFIGINSAIWYNFSRISIHLSRNPYFIGINSAIKLKQVELELMLMSQSLFYWN